jgi:beta-galactosidase
VLLDGRPLTGWRSEPLHLDPASIRAKLSEETHVQRAGAFAAAGEFLLERPADLYLETRGWTKGIAFVNGFNLGRYWSRGPQRTLYVPAPVTRAGANELIMIELHGTTTSAVRFIAEPDLGPDEP